MESTLLIGSRHDWLVVGSNGAIGSEMTQALRQSSQTNKMYAPKVEIHSRSKYSESVFRAIKARRNPRPLRLLFCAGKGGFSLSQNLADQQEKEFAEFYSKLTFLPSLEKMVYVSSLGAHCSRIKSPYSNLIKKNEKGLLSSLSSRSLIIRVPSVYGYNEYSKRYHGLIGILLSNLRTNSPTSIYSHFSTRRNYISIRHLAQKLVCEHLEKINHDEHGCLNVQAPASLSVLDVCSIITKITKRRPALRPMPASILDAEHHWPNAVSGAKIVISDSVKEWVHFQWHRTPRSCPSLFQFMPARKH